MARYSNTKDDIENENLVVATFLLLELSSEKEELTEPMGGLYVIGEDGVIVYL